MSDEYSVQTRFLMGKIDEAEYRRKMAYMRAKEEEEERAMESVRKAEREAGVDA